MAFGGSWRNKTLPTKKLIRNPGKQEIIVEAFVPNVWRLAEAPYSFRYGLADYA